jgi:hypothetical protein
MSAMTSDKLTNNDFWIRHADLPTAPIVGADGTVVQRKVFPYPSQIKSRTRAQLAVLTSGNHIEGENRMRAKAVSLSSGASGSYRTENNFVSGDWCLTGFLATGSNVIDLKTPLYSNAALVNGLPADLTPSTDTDNILYMLYLG